MPLWLRGDVRVKFTRNSSLPLPVVSPSEAVKTCRKTKENDTLEHVPAANEYIHRRL